MGLPALRGRLLRNGRTSALTHRSISIVADWRLDVCDGAHRIFVMKNVEVRLRWSAKNPKAVGGRGISPFKKRRVGQPRNYLVLIGVYQPGLCNFGNASVFALPTIRQVTGRFWGCERYRDFATVTGHDAVGRAKRQPQAFRATMIPRTICVPSGRERGNWSLMES